MREEKEYISIRTEKACEMDSRDFDVRYDRDTPLEELQKKSIVPGYRILHDSGHYTWIAKEDFDNVFREMTDKDREFLRGLEHEKK
jgi:hypothetical protein